MKIFYTASYAGKEQYQSQYNKVLKEIESHEVELISPEKGNYKDSPSLGLEWSESAQEVDHYSAIKKGITWADGVIIEISHEDFLLGHEATLAIQSKKPVLCLSLNENYTGKVKSRFFHAAKYNDYNLKEIIDGFMKVVSGEVLSERFNFFLSKSQLQYLEEQSKDFGVNKSEYLRRLLDQDRREEANPPN